MPRSLRSVQGAGVGSGKAFAYGDRQSKSGLRLTNSGQTLFTDNIMITKKTSAVQSLSAPAPCKNRKERGTHWLVFFFALTASYFNPVTTYASDRVRT